MISADRVRIFATANQRMTARTSGIAAVAMSILIATGVLGGSSANAGEVHKYFDQQQFRYDLSIGKNWAFGFSETATRPSTGISLDFDQILRTSSGPDLHSSIDSARNFERRFAGNSDQQRGLPLVVFRPGEDALADIPKDVIRTIGGIMETAVGMPINVTAASGSLLSCNL